MFVDTQSRPLTLPDPPPNDGTHTPTQQSMRETHAAVVETTMVTSNKTTCGWRPPWRSCCSSEATPLFSLRVFLLPKDSSSPLGRGGDRSLCSPLGPSPFIDLKKITHFGLDGADFLDSVCTASSRVFPPPFPFASGLHQLYSGGGGGVPIRKDVPLPSTASCSAPSMATVTATGTDQARRTTVSLSYVFSTPQAYKQERDNTMF